MLTEREVSFFLPQLFSFIFNQFHYLFIYLFFFQNWEAMGPHFWIKQCIEVRDPSC